MRVCLIGKGKAHFRWNSFFFFLLFTQIIPSSEAFHRNRHFWAQNYRSFAADNDRSQGLRRFLRREIKENLRSVPAFSFPDTLNGVTQSSVTSPTISHLQIEQFPVEIGGWIWMVLRFDWKEVERGKERKRVIIIIQCDGTNNDYVSSCFIPELADQFILSILHGATVTNIHRKSRGGKERNPEVAKDKIPRREKTKSRGVTKNLGFNYTEENPEEAKGKFGGVTKELVFDYTEGNRGGNQENPEK
ncbi:hypothetical protein CEXT_813531 [Caerostris extrusa]|uniref:Uncharacterized protein n=1 Tax=Caerostris extrusa TaxID=172846 RepID=A0AAV4MEI6_CAEEX|nr:hypothetical protein CEXT_813531 [Caerostris extrusa]